MAAQVFLFDIQRFSIHDGPGIRTTVFFKGCSLHCHWCHNPESISSKAQYRYNASKCINCGACLTASKHIATHPVQLLGLDAEPEVVTHCPTGALSIAGKLWSIPDIMNIVRKDKAFYLASGGGVTISGGEPALQAEGATALLEACQAEGIHTAMETAGNVPWESLQQLYPYLNLILFDLKHLDPEQHHYLTGSKNTLIQSNLEDLLTETEVELIVRIPVIPGYNDQAENWLALKNLLQRLPRRPQIEFLPYHKLGMGKYAEVGKPYTLAEVVEPEPALIKRLQGEFGGDTDATAHSSLSRS